MSVEGTSQTGLTDTNGHFVLNGVTAGSYLVRVVKSGYEGVSTPVLNLVGGEHRVLAEPLALTLSRGGLAGTRSCSPTRRTTRRAASSR